MKTKKTQTPLLLAARGFPSNTPMPRPTPLTTPNGIWIHSAVLPQYTFRTDRQTDQPTDRWSRRETCKKFKRVLMLKSDALKRN